tara:strand:- start:59 stop:277 length:219 start_codon:yes stop_codon:yes gene_type:complete
LDIGENNMNNKKKIRVFSINLKDMYLETKNPKKHQQRFKSWLIKKEDNTNKLIKENKILKSKVKCYEEDLNK